MRLLTDYHLHTKNGRFFHARNSIEEMVYSANAIGLNEIAITDHGFRHLCGTSKEKIKKARAMIDDINTWSSTKVLLGIEADIIAEDGTIDVDNETLAMIDILIVGYHRLIKTDFAGFFGNVEKTKEAKDKCTRAFVNAINRYPVNIVSHIDSILETDLYEIGVACRQRGTLIEINNRHTNWTQDQVDELLASGCLFAVCSDAHRREDVGNVDRAFEIIKKYDIPSDLIMNVEFDYSEKSEDQKQDEIAFSFYNKKKQEEAEKKKKQQEVKRVEFTESLSPEMEKALADIAKEKGLEYVKKGEEPSAEEKEIDFATYEFDYAFMSPEEIELIKQAQEILKKHKQEEVEAKDENEFSFVEPVVEEIVTESQSNQPVMTGAEVKNEIDKLLNEEVVAEPIAVVETPAEVLETENAVETSKEEVKLPAENVEKTTPATADEILKALQEVKSAQANVKDANAPKQKIVMDIEKNTNVPVRKTTGGKPKIVDVDVETMAQKPAKAESAKPSKTRKGYGGFMGGTGGFVALSEENEKKGASKITTNKDEK